MEDELKFVIAMGIVAVWTILMAIAIRLGELVEAVEALR